MFLSNPSSHIPPSSDIWDTAGQERFNSMHASYYYRANACIMVFDVTRKVCVHALLTGRRDTGHWEEGHRTLGGGTPTLHTASSLDGDWGRGTITPWLYLCVMRSYVL